MKRFLLYIGIAIAAIGCAKDGEFAMSSGDVLTISSDIATRADKSSWAGNESIGVYMSTTPATTTGDVGSNVEHTNTTEKPGVFTSETPIYYPHNTTVSILAYYPYVNGVDHTSYYIDSSLSDQVDLLVANASGLSSSSEAVDLTFEHKLSRLSITIEAEGDGITIADLANVEVKVGTLLSKAYFNISDGTVNSNNQTNGDLTLSTVTTTSGSTTIESIVSSAIVIPCDFSNGTITFTLKDGSDRVFDADFPTATFESGNQYNYTAKIGYGKVTITKSSITGWDPNTYDDQVADIVDIELKGDIYYINSAKGLAAFRDLVNGVGSNSKEAVIAGFNDDVFTTSNQLAIKGKLTRDIDLSTICNSTGDGSWSPIGYYSESLPNEDVIGYNRYYKGTFDGCGYKIKNLYISTTGNMQSLFRGLYTDGVVCNLGVEGSITHTTSGNLESGGIVSHNYGSIINCYSEVTVTTNITNAGGIAAYNTASGKIINCYNHGNVSGAENVGGIVGYNDDGFVGHCYNSGSISSTNSAAKIGGVVGWNAVDSDVLNIKGSFCENTTQYSIGQIKYTGSDGSTSNVCSKEYLQSESFVTTINNSCASYGYDLTATPCPCGFVAVSGDYPTLNFGNVVTNTDVDISYNSLSYNINTAKGLEAFAALVNGTAMPTGVTTSGNTTSGDDIYFQFKNSNYTYSEIDGNLKANITLEDICNSDNGGTNWTPIGSSSAPYKGIFNGGGFLVSDLYISTNTTKQGLFGSVSGATIYNLGVDGEVTGGSSVGGLVGENNGGTIINCYNTCTVKGVNNTGGVVGANTSYTDDGNTIYGNVINIYNRGNVSGTSSGSIVGGMVGFNDSGCSIISGYNTGTVSTGTNVGGVVGLNESASENITGCFFLSSSASYCIGSDDTSGSLNDFDIGGISDLIDDLNEEAGDYNDDNSDATYKACVWEAEDATNGYPIHDFGTDAE